MHYVLIKHHSKIVMGDALLTWGDLWKMEIYASSLRMANLLASFAFTL